MTSSERKAKRLTMITKVIYKGVLTPGRVSRTKPKTVLLTTISDFDFRNNFSLFQLLQTMLAIYGFHLENNCLRKLYIKNPAI